jgi:hypothetical protein
MKSPTPAVLHQRPPQHHGAQRHDGHGVALLDHERDAAGKHHTHDRVVARLTRVGGKLGKLRRRWPFPASGTRSAGPRPGRGARGVGGGADRRLVDGACGGGREQVSDRKRVLAKVAPRHPRHVPGGNGRDAPEVLGFVPQVVGHRLVVAELLRLALHSLLVVDRVRFQVDFRLA